ncbi:uncharacterized protein TRIADDRAFT_26082 [Trichoplax adhaerens]|uniref:Serine/threonine-protein kinase 40 n=1 Tax=Trichoplax adhaerens TaxID=10228 RepID=B3RYQ8_TRIAD|nr:hypothetical protein TRIADDRAFT_26082 [Trichoplax adhaerens]EDV24637.1 hypothetical protein TRIADDRAFT_26082 [Trichoplax adhaerens]|eukprot:XP_002112527.1 hypothetical protein TRIADDRAFT_26082 [Trichoplax adhaerens]
MDNSHHKQANITRPKCNAKIKRAGPYLLGPRVGNSPVRSIVQCLAKLEGTDQFYTMKILTLKDLTEEKQDDIQGKMLMHTEFSLLSLLQGEPGVVQMHRFFQDEVYEQPTVPSSPPPPSPANDRKHDNVKQLPKRKRLCMALDCLYPHDYNHSSGDLINCQHYVIREKRLSEMEAIMIFTDIMKVVENLHKKNIVHRDLKLGNMVLNKRTRRVTITNFCLGKHLLSDDELLTDQRGSPAYISPDVLSGTPYAGKASDIWALGVVLFTMLYGQFPFYDNMPHELFRKIKAAEYLLPDDHRVSPAVKCIIKKILVLNPKKRPTASDLLRHSYSLLYTW